MPKESSKKLTVGDLEDFREGKFRKRRAMLPAKIFLLLIFSSVMLFLLGSVNRFSMELLQDTALGLSSDALTAAVLFVLFELYWAKRNADFREAEEELAQASEEFDKTLQEFTKTFADQIASIAAPRTSFGPSRSEAE